MCVQGYTHSLSAYYLSLQDFGLRCAEDLETLSYVFIRLHGKSVLSTPSSRDPAKLLREQDDDLPEIKTRAKTLSEGEDYGPWTIPSTDSDSKM